MTPFGKILLAFVALSIVGLVAIMSRSESTTMITLTIASLVYYALSIWED